MSIVVTGGAGFIGSCIVRMLNDKGYSDLIIVDNINTTEKWLNIRNKKYSEYVCKDEFLSKLESYKDITNIIHMGACSSTTERDFDYLYKNNFEYTKCLWEYCAKKKLSFIYASSAATYGDGVDGFDDKKDISVLQPLNRYGYSKHIFDLWAEKQENKPRQCVGLKFFNVFGPNEYAKAGMASMVFHGYNQIKENGKVKLFKSYKEGFSDGKQLRDFVYVKDVCKVVEFMLDTPSVSGLYNVGTGRAESFNRLIETVFKALGKSSVIEYVDMPEVLKAKYQYYTKAENEKLKEAGYKLEFYTLEEAVKDYVVGYLNKEYLVL